MFNSGARLERPWHLEGATLEENTRAMRAFQVQWHLFNPGNPEPLIFSPSHHLFNPSHSDHHLLTVSPHHHILDGWGRGIGLYRVPRSRPRGEPWIYIISFYILYYFILYIQEVSFRYIISFYLFLNWISKGFYRLPWSQRAGGRQQFCGKFLRRTHFLWTSPCWVKKTCQKQNDNYQIIQDPLKT